jgi:hypothetical protein
MESRSKLSSGSHEHELLSNPYCLPMLEAINSLVSEPKSSRFELHQLLAVQSALKNMSTLQCSGCDGLGHSWNGNKHRPPCPSREEVHRGISGSTNAASSVLAAAELIVRADSNFQCGRVNYAVPVMIGRFQPEVALSQAKEVYNRCGGTAEEEKFSFKQKAE